MTLAESIVRILLEESFRIRGEYWIVDGDVMFADGDVGDMNHEAYAIDHARRQIIDHFGGDSDSEFIDDDDLKNAVIEGLAADGIQADPDDWYGAAVQSFSDDPQTAQVMKETLAVAIGQGDAREHAMRYWGWKWCRGNNISTWTFTSSDRQQIVRGLNDIVGQEMDADEVPDESVEVTIGVGATGKRYAMTLAELASGRVVSQDPTWGAMRESEPDDMMAYMMPEIERINTNRKLRVGEEVSDGTHDMVALCERGLRKLQEIHYDGYRKFVEINAEPIEGLKMIIASHEGGADFEGDDAVAAHEAVEGLWDALVELFSNDYCPFATHFGPHEGSYSCWGCWPSKDYIQDLIGEDEILRVFSDREYDLPETVGADPKGRYQYAVNVHGNQAMYDKDGNMIWKY